MAEIHFLCKIATLGMAKRICKLISFLLELGPLNSILTEIFENCTNSLLPYFFERSKIIQENNPLYIQTNFALKQHIMYTDLRSSKHTIK